MSVKESPVSPPWMDKNLLELWLQTHYSDLKVEEYEIQTATSKGDNYLSNMYRLVVKTKSGGSHHLIIKCQMEDGTTAHVMKNTHIFNKEKELYSNTLPRMTALLKKNISEDIELLAPICFYASRSFIVLEDLTAEGFTMMERRQGLDLNQCLLVMRHLAKFHAASAVLHQQDPASMEKFHVNFFSQPNLQGKWCEFFSGMAMSLAEELETWTEEWWTYSKKLRNMADSLFRRVQKVTLRDDTKFNVLMHGDLWINNMLFRGGASSVRFVDYQLSHFTSPAIDLQYFLTTSASEEVRVSHIDRLLQEYHSWLRDTLIALRYESTPITLQELHEEFDRKVAYGLFALILPLAVVQSEPDSGFSFDEALETGKTPGPSMYSENYRNAARWLLPIFDRKGAFEDKL